MRSLMRAAVVSGLLMLVTCASHSQDQTEKQEAGNSKPQNNREVNINGKTIQQWMADAKSPDKVVRREAAKYLTQGIHPQDKELTELAFALLRDEDAQVRREIIETLARSSVDRDRFHANLANSLQDRDASVRRAAAAATRDNVIVSPPLALVPDLRKALADSDPLVRAEAAMSLIQVDSTYAAEAFPHLLGALPKLESHERCMVLMMLPLAKDAARPAIPHLKEIIKSRTKEERSSAIRALLAIDPTQGRELLPLFIESLPDLVRGIGPDFGLCETYRRLAWNHKETVPALVEAMKQPATRGQALWVLSYIGPRARIAVPALREALRSTDAEERAMAAWGLLAIDPTLTKEAVPILLQQFPPKEKDNIGIIAMFADLGPHARESIPALLAVMKDKQARDRIDLELVKALAAMTADSKEAMDLLVDLARSSDSVELLLAAKAVDEIGMPSPVSQALVASVMKGDDEAVNLMSLPFLVKPLAKSDPERAAVLLPKLLPIIRSRQGDFMELVEALTFMGPFATAAASDLVTLYRKGDEEENEWHRLSILRALAAVSPPEARKLVPELAAQLKSTKPSKRRFAVQALVELGSVCQAALPALTEALKNPELQCHAAQALGRLGPAAQPAMNVLLLRLNLASFSVLPQPPHRKAAELVADLLADPDFGAEDRAINVFQRGLPYPEGFDMVIKLAANQAKGTRVLFLEEGARALGRMGPATPATVVMLRKLSQHPEAVVRWAALIAWAKTDKECRREVLPALRQALQSPEWTVRVGALHALEEMDALAEAMPDVRMLQQDYVGYVRKEARMALLRSQSSRR